MTVLLNGTPTFEWYISSSIVKKGLQEDRMCFDKMGLGSQIIDIVVICSVVNKIRRT